MNKCTSPSSSRRVPEGSDQHPSWGSPLHQCGGETSLLRELPAGFHQQLPRHAASCPGNALISQKQNKILASTNMRTFDGSLNSGGVSDAIRWIPCVCFQDHPEHGVLYLVRGLLNMVQDYTWEDNSDAKVRVYISALPLLAAMCQETYLYSIPKGKNKQRISMF